LVKTVKNATIGFLKKEDMHKRKDSKPLCNCVACIIEFIVLSYAFKLKSNWIFSSHLINKIPVQKKLFKSMLSYGLHIEKL